MPHPLSWRNSHAGNDCTIQGEVAKIAGIVFLCRNANAPFASRDGRLITGQQQCTTTTAELILGPSTNTDATGGSDMHMLLVIVGGVILLGVFLLFGRLWGGDMAALALAAKAFLPVWLAISVVNLWVGVSHAGYSVREELPILLVVFLVPAVLAGVLIWKQA